LRSASLTGEMTGRASNRQPNLARKLATHELSGTATSMAMQPTVRTAQRSTSGGRDVVNAEGSDRIPRAVEIDCFLETPSQSR